MLTDLAPADPLMRQAWLDALRWAIGEPDLVARFRTETGNKWSPGRSPIEAMIDEATGADRDFLVSFVRWFNGNVWGDEVNP